MYVKVSVYWIFLNKMHQSLQGINLINKNVQAKNLFTLLVWVKVNSISVVLEKMRAKPSESWIFMGVFISLGNKRVQ